MDNFSEKIMSGKMIRIVLTSILFPFGLMAQNLTIESPLRFLALGDSYTIGQSVPVNERWPVQLSDSLLTRGFITDTLSIIATTGWRTDNLINAIRNHNLEHKQYNLVSLLIGVNNQYQGHPFSQYVSEFPALVDSAIRYAGGDKSHVFIVSIPDYAYSPFGQQSSNPGQISEQIDQYNDFNKHIADSLQITYFDITPISRLGLLHPEYVASDGLHPSGIQYREWVNLMSAFIDNELTGINSDENQNDLEVKIDPNPTNGEILIDIPEVINPQAVSIEMYSLSGQLVLEQNISERHFKLSISRFPDGLYLLKISSGAKQTVRRIIKRN
jgi:lysophospholipase L1-like esterase